MDKGYILDGMTVAYYAGSSTTIYYCFAVQQGRIFHTYHFGIALYHSLQPMQYTYTTLIFSFS